MHAIWRIHLDGGWNRNRTPPVARWFGCSSDQSHPSRCRRRRSETTRIDLRVVEVPVPRPGDRIEIDGEAFLIQGEPVRDRERLVWTVDLRPA